MQAAVASSTTCRAAAPPPNARSRHQHSAAGPKSHLVWPAFWTTPSQEPGPALAQKLRQLLRGRVEYAGGA